MAETSKKLFPNHIVVTEDGYIQCDKATFTSGTLSFNP